jgi:hypothetical protein
MLRRRVAPLLVAVLVAASGCVSAMSARNYVPQNPAVDQSYYGCLRDAQQEFYRARYGAYANSYSYGASGGAAAGAETNTEMLKSCMGAKGYYKRSASSTELWIGWLTAPVWVPLCVVGMAEGVNCFSNL